MSYNEVAKKHVLINRTDDIQVARNLIIMTNDYIQYTQAAIALEPPRRYTEKNLRNMASGRLKMSQGFGK